MGKGFQSITQRFLSERSEETESTCRTAILSLLEHAPNMRFLDLGCGDGDFTLRAAERVGTNIVYGVDIVHENITLARRKGIRALDTDLNHGLPFGTNSMDVVCASHVIEHLDDTDVFLKEINRVLRPGGYLVIATPNLAAWHQVLLLLLGKQPTIAEVSDVALVGTWSPRGRCVARLGPAHRRIFTLGAIEGLLKYYDLRVEKTVGSGFFPFSGPLATLLSNIDKRHATNLVVKARKPTGYSGAYEGGQRRANQAT